MLLLLTMCCFCCMGRKSTRLYDRLFNLYNLLVCFNILGYMWLIVVRFRHAGKVCSGDFVYQDQQDVIFADFTESEYYLSRLGRLLRWYFGIETILAFCCVSLSTLWFCYTPNATSRFWATVEYQNAEAQ